MSNIEVDLLDFGFNEAGKITINNIDINCCSIDYNSENSRVVNIDFAKIKDKELLKLVVILYNNLKSMIEDKNG